MLLLAAETERERDAWLDRLRKAMAARRINRLALRMAIDRCACPAPVGAEEDCEVPRSTMTRLSLRQLVREAARSEEGSAILAESGLRAGDCEPHLNDADLATLLEPLRRNSVRRERTPLATQEHSLQGVPGSATDYFWPPRLRH